MDTTTSEEVKATSEAQDDSHLLLEIDQATYDAVMEVRDAAESRGLNTEFVYWLGSMARKHSKVQLDLWNKADDVATFKRAKEGHLPSQIVVLGQLGIKGATPEVARKFFSQYK